MSVRRARDMAHYDYSTRHARRSRGHKAAISAIVVGVLVGVVSACTWLAVTNDFAVGAPGDRLPTPGFATKSAKAGSENPSPSSKSHSAVVSPAPSRKQPRPTTATPSAARQLPSSQPTVTDAAPPSDLPAVTNQAVKSYLKAAETANAIKKIGTPRGKVTSPMLSKTATDAALAELEADQAELAAFGWTRRGSVQVENLKILKSQPHSKPTTIVVEACFDSTQVITYDSKAKPLPVNKAAQRSLNIVTLRLIKHRWLVVDRTFPKDPAC